MSYHSILSMTFLICSLMYFITCAILSHHTAKLGWSYWQQFPHAKRCRLVLCTIGFCTKLWHCQNRYRGFWNRLKLSELHNFCDASAQLTSNRNWNYHDKGQNHTWIRWIDANLLNDWLRNCLNLSWEITQFIPIISYNVSSDIW